MHSSFVSRAVHKPLIQFVGSRVNLWKSMCDFCFLLLWPSLIFLLFFLGPLDAQHTVGPHPLTPANLEKHVAKASAQPAAAKSPATGSLEFGQRPARYYRAPMSELEMEAIEVKFLERVYGIICCC